MAKGKKDANAPKDRWYSTPRGLLNPVHRVSVIVVGAGGTGSHFLYGLAELHATLQMLGHPGFAVAVYDDDVVEAHNPGRQRFGVHDVGLAKCVAIVARLNRMYNLDWSAKPHRLSNPEKWSSLMPNIIVTCVDHDETRTHVHKAFREALRRTDRNIAEIEEVEHGELLTAHYWLDMGNGKDFGQAVLGSRQLMDTYQLHGANLEHSNEPSCSMEESLRRQDLFINAHVANLGLIMLWNLFRRGGIKDNVAYTTIEDGQIRTRTTCKPVKHERKSKDQGNAAGKNRHKPVRQRRRIRTPLAEEPETRPEG